MTNTQTFTVQPEFIVGNVAFASESFNKITPPFIPTHPDVFKDVGEFMEAGDQKPSESLRNLYKNLITEEYNEFLEGTKNQDDVEILDGIVDLIWVCAGYCHAAGFDFNGAWREITASNMSKMDPVTGKAIKSDTGKIMKPDSYFAPNLKPFV